MQCSLTFTRSVKSGRNRNFHFHCHFFFLFIKKIYNCILLLVKKKKKLLDTICVKCIMLRASLSYHNFKSDVPSVRTGGFTPAIAPNPLFIPNVTTSLRGTQYTALLNISSFSVMLSCTTKINSSILSFRYFFFSCTSLLLWTLNTWHTDKGKVRLAYSQNKNQTSLPGCGFFTLLLLMANLVGASQTTLLPPRSIFGSLAH